MTDMQVDVNQLPEELGLNAGSLKQQFKTPIEGWMPLEITSVKKGVAKTGTFKLDMNVAPVDEEGNRVAGVSSRFTIYMPVANPNVPGHTKPNTGLSCYFAALALEEGFPRKPQKQQDGTYALPDGRIVTKDEAGLIYDSIDDKVSALVNGWWRDTTSLVGRRFYGKILHEQGQDGKIYTKVDRTRAEPPVDEELITSGFTG